MEDFNSSDIEFEPASPKVKGMKHGQASVDILIAKAQANRIKSKQTLKQLAFGTGTASNKIMQHLWIRRFNTFREHSLRQSIEETFTGTEVIRFFDCIIDIVIPTDKDKSSPNRNLVDDAFKVIVAYGEFTYIDFKITKQHRMWFHTWVDDAVRTGRLIQGRWRGRTWLGIVTLTRMIKKFLEHWHEHGTWSWDVVISKCLSIVLVAALSSRAGDVTRSANYSGDEYMQWRHIEITCYGEARFCNLRAVIVLEYTKCQKITVNTELRRYLSPIKDANFQHICPLALLLIHALRNGLVHGTNLQQVLDHAVSTPSRRIAWKFPNRPVIPIIARKPARCNLDNPATPAQQLETIKHMGLISNVISRVYTHALRLGAARDIAHLPPPEKNCGVATDEVRLALGHSISSFQSGITQDYIGDPSREWYNDRFSNISTDNHCQPLFSKESLLKAFNAPVSEEEIRNWQQKYESSTSPRRPLSEKNAKKRAQNGVRRDRQKHFIQNAAPDTPYPQAMPLSSLPERETNKSSDCQSPMRKRQKTTPTHDIESTPSATNVKEDHTDLDERTSLADSNTKPLDEDDLTDAKVNEIELNDLVTDLFSGDDDDIIGDSTYEPGGALAPIQTNVLAEMAMDVTYGKDIGTKTLTAEEFIESYATINIVHNNGFASEWTAYSCKAKAFEDSIGKHSMMGNSRDAPTVFYLYCRKTEGCTYRTTQIRFLEQHQLACTKELVELQKSSSKVECPWRDCGKSYADNFSLRSHILRTHKWEPKACGHGCDPTKEYMTQSSYTDHQIKMHSGRWPVSCIFPGCTSEKLFKCQKTLSYHLRKDHGVETATDQVQYLPPRPTINVFVRQSCIIDSCTNETKHPSKSRMVLHLCSYHGMKQADAEALVDEKAETVEQTPKIHTHASTKRATKRAHGT